MLFFSFFNVVIYLFQEAQSVDSYKNHMEKPRWVRAEGSVTHRNTYGH